MLGFIKNSKFVFKLKQIKKVKEMRKHMCCDREPNVVTVEYMAAYMQPYSEMPVRQAIKLAKEYIKYFGRD